MGKRYIGLSSGPRSRLAEVVPLEAPICIRVSPTTACNLKCKFCAHSLPAEQLGFPNITMPMELFRHVIDDIKESFGSIKKVFLVGLGEPLLHPQIAEMAAYISQQKVCDTCEIITNGTLLSPTRVDSLVAAGLPRLKISINGLSEEEYEQNCGVHVDFGQLLKNIHYLYEHKGNTQIIIKIIDYMVQTEDRKERFFELFEPYSDLISIENLIKGNTPIEYEKLGGESFQMHTTMCNSALAEADICTMPFYTMQVNEDGSVSPCCAESRICVGNITKHSLRQIWEGYEFTSLQYGLLCQGKMHPVCRTCQYKQFAVYPEDMLEPVREPLQAALLKRMSMC